MQYLYNITKNHFLCCIMITMLTGLMQSVDSIVVSRLRDGKKVSITSEIEVILSEYGITSDDVNAEIDHVLPFTDGSITWRKQKLDPYDELCIARFFIFKAHAYTKEDLNVLTTYNLSWKEVYRMSARDREIYGLSQEFRKSMEMIDALVPTEMLRMQHEEDAKKKIVRFYQEFKFKTENRITFLNDLVLTFSRAYLDGNVDYTLKNIPCIIDSIKTVLAAMWLSEALGDGYEEGIFEEMPSDVYALVLEDMCYEQELQSDNNKD